MAAGGGEQVGDHAGAAADGGGGVAHAVAIGEDQHGLVRGIELREGAFKVEDADLAGVGFALAAFAPSGVAELGSPGVAEGDAIGGPLFEAQDG